MRKLLLLLGMIGMIGAVPPAAARPAPDCEQIAVETYDVDTSGLRRSYQIGDTLRARLVVTRTETGTPVEDATVGIVLRNKDDFFAALGPTTDVAGGAEVRGVLDGLEPGRYDFLAYAFTRVDAVCVALHEYGLDYRERGVRIRP